MAESAVALVTIFTFDFFFSLFSVYHFTASVLGDLGSRLGSWENGIMRVYGVPSRGCNGLDDLHEIRFLSLLSSFFCLFYIRDEF